MDELTIKYTTQPTCMITTRQASPVHAVNSPSYTQDQVQSPKKRRKSRVIYDFSKEELSQFFHVPQREAARLLGVAPITIKRNCKRLKFEWPYRKNRIRRHQGCNTDSPDHGQSENDHDMDDSSQYSVDGSDSDDETIVIVSRTKSEALKLYASLPRLLAMEDADMNEVEDETPIHA